MRVLLWTLAAFSVLALAPSAQASLLAPRGVCPNPWLSAPLSVQRPAMRCFHHYARRRAGLQHLRAAGLGAHRKAWWIVRCRDFSHTACGWPITRSFRGFPNTLYGENIAWWSGRGGRARPIFRAWLHSPAHREEILDGRFSRMGVGRVHRRWLFGHPNVTVWVVHFIRP